MKLVITVLAAAALVNAQNSTLIPANISTGCSSFLTTLNSDPTLSTCVQPLLNATATFSPTASSNLSTDDINYTLATICKTSSGCSDATIRTWLSSFYSSCYDELTSSTAYNSDVRELYDILYVINPLKSAVCAIDSANQDYCVNEIVAAEKANGTTPSASASASSIANNTLLVALATTETVSPVTFAAENLYITLTSSTSSLAKRFLNLLTPRADDGAQSVNLATTVAPNATTYKSTNLPFLFLQPDMTSSALCTPCTREVMVAYIKWESKQPYALGLSQSPILGGQSALWSAIGSTCGTGYVNAITSEVGSFVQSTGNATSGAEERWGRSSVGVVGMAVVAGAVALIA